MARPILIKERNGRGGHRYAVVHSGELTVEDTADAAEAVRRVGGDAAEAIEQIARECT